jgi:hypothetical protein
MKAKRLSRSIEQGSAADSAGRDTWIDNELMGCVFPDARKRPEFLSITHKLNSFEY